MINIGKSSRMLTSYSPSSSLINLVKSVNSSESTLLSLKKSSEELVDLDKGSFKLIEGNNRDVFLDYENKVGYKILKKHNVNLSRDLTNELILNQIYQSDSFYDGQYSDLKVEMSNVLFNGAMVKALKFNIIASARDMKPDEYLPATLLESFSKSGLFHTDLKRQNFMVVTTPLGDSHFIPIDGKRIISYPKKSLMRKPMEEMYSGTDIIDFNS